MTIVHDDAGGWILHEGEPRWRGTTAACRRIEGADIAWLATAHARVAHLVDRETGRNGVHVAVIRHVPAHRQWIVRIDGIAVWGMNRMLGHEHYKDVAAFAKVADARGHVETVLKQAGGTIIGKARA